MIIVALLAKCGYGENGHPDIYERMSFWQSYDATSTVASAVPPPSEIPAKIIVHGRTATAVDIPIVKVGQNIPRTYSAGRINNTPGFEFYVSEHFALKTSMDEAFSREKLTLAELAYPFGVSIVGAEPPDPGIRMYMVYANSVKQLQQAMISDIGTAPSGFLGGFTVWVNFGSYNLPGGGLQYHRRGLVIHENLHMLDMIVNDRVGEDITYSIEQHVYDSAKKQLTVYCYDRAPINNHTAGELGGLQSKPVPLTEGGGSFNFLRFCLSEPDRYFKWCVKRDENVPGLSQVFGPLDKLDADWQKWIKERRTSFVHADWGWEQNGDAIWAYGWPWDPKYWSQMNLMYSPGEVVTYDPMRMDYPADPMPPTVGPVKRGVKEPSVGFVISGVGGGCWGGVGLGVEGRSMCQVVIAGNRKLVIDGNDWGIARKEVALTPEIIEAAGKDGGRHGVTIKIGKKELQVTVRVGTNDVKEIKTAVPITEAQRERLLTKQMTMIGRDGYPSISPFIDDMRPTDIDYMKPAPANYWEYEGQAQLLGLYTAAWRLGDKAPESLISLENRMLKTVGKSTAKQKRGIKAYEKKIMKVVDDVKRCEADDAIKNMAIADLAGVTIRYDDVWSCETTNTIEVGARIWARSDDPVKCSVRTVVSGNPALAEASSERRDFEFNPRRLNVFTQRLNLSSQPVRPTVLATTFDLTWRGEKISLSFTKELMNPTIPAWLVIGPFTNSGVAVTNEIEVGAFDRKKEYAGMNGNVTWQRVLPSYANVLKENVVYFDGLFGNRENVTAYAQVYVNSGKEQDAVLAFGSDDGAVIWLNDKEVFRNLAARGYSAGSDRINIHLKQGSNKLLVRVDQLTGPWQMSGSILDKDGKPLTDLEYTIE